MTEQVETDVLVVGAGPAGLSAATRLRELGAGRVLVVDREPQAGGIPRHCHHTGFGWFDLRRILSGPTYAAEHLHRARQAGVDVAVETTAVRWTGPLCLQTTSPVGLRHITARAVLLATGCRERPRAARLVPGSRPLGIFNTGSVQQLAYLKNMRVGTKAVVVGAEHVSFSAVHTLAGNGAQVIAMITDLPRHQTYAPFYWMMRALYRFPVLFGCRVTGIRGRKRVEAIEITFAATREKRLLPCDTVVFTGDWIPDNELARKTDIAIDRNTRGPEVDQGLRTSRRGVFAAGNLLRGAETADTASLEGCHAAHSIARYLSRGDWPETNRLPIAVEPPLCWISPNVFAPGGNSVFPLDRFTFRTTAFLTNPRIEVYQGDRRLYTRTFRRLVPNRSLHLASHWVSQLGPDPQQREVRIRVSQPV